MKRIIYLLSMILCINTMVAQTKVAVYVTDTENVSTTKKQIVGSEIVAALVNNEQYNAVERTADFLNKISQEQSYQRSGQVDTEQISELGRQFGVDLVCVVDIMLVENSYYIQARMIDVETATIIKTAKEISTLESLESIVNISEKLANKLVSVQEQVPQEIRYSTYESRKDENMSIISIERKEIETIVRFKYVWFPINRNYTPSISVSPETNIKDRGTGQTYTIKEALGIPLSPQSKQMTDGIHDVTLIFPALPISAETIDIVCPNNTYFNFNYISLIPSLPNSNIFLFEDDSESRYNSLQTQYNEQVAMQARREAEQRTRVAEAMQATQEMLDGVMENTDIYYLKVINKRNYAIKFYLAGEYVGDIGAGKSYTFTLKRDVRAWKYVQKNGYLLYPTVGEGMIPPQNRYDTFRLIIN